MDFLPLIEILTAKGIRKLPSSPIRTQVHMYKFEMIIITTTGKNTENGQYCGHISQNLKTASTGSSITPIMLLFPYRSSDEF